MPVARQQQIVDMRCGIDTRCRSRNVFAFAAFQLIVTFAAAALFTAGSVVIARVIFVISQITFSTALDLNIQANLGADVHANMGRF